MEFGGVLPDENIHLTSYDKDSKKIKGLENMKFDVVIGNPPYQDGSKEGQQNKIYNQFSKKAIDSVKKDGHVLFITPSSVCKESKRFSLVGAQGLRCVDFTANDHFSVGVNICHWHIDKGYGGNVNVISSKGDEKEFAKNSVIYDHSIHEEWLMKLRTVIKRVSADPSGRMFKRNNPGPTTSKAKTSEFCYPLHKSENEILCYVKKEPFYSGKKKMIISMTKSFDKKNIVYSTKDYHDGTVATSLTNNDEIANIKSFIFCKYFVTLVNKWKLVDGYGFNEAIKYLPPFDKTKPWTNEEVKDFLESFLED